MKMLIAAVCLMLPLWSEAAPENAGTSVAGEQSGKLLELIGELRKSAPLPAGDAAEMSEYLLRLFEQAPQVTATAQDGEELTAALAAHYAVELLSVDDSSRKEARARDFEARLRAMLVRPGLPASLRKSIEKDAIICAAMAESASSSPDPARIRAGIDSFYAPRSAGRGASEVELAYAAKDLEFGYYEVLRRTDPPAARRHLEQLAAWDTPAVAKEAERLLYLEHLRTVPVDLRFTAMDGSAVDLAKLRGKVVLLDFVGVTWCGGCRRQDPYVKAAFAKYREQGFEVLTITNEGSPEKRQKVLQLIAERGHRWPHYFDGKGVENPIIDKFHVDAFPTHLLFDRNGILASTDAYSLKLESQVAQLLQKR